MKTITSEKYLYDQFKKLQTTKYGFSIKIFDGVGNETNQMELTPNRLKDLLKLFNTLDENIT
jgi:hypothetical protein